MNPIFEKTLPREIDVGGKGITNPFPLPADVLSHIFSFLPLSDKLNFAKTNYSNLFLFYASSVLKGPDGANARCQQGMSAIINIIPNSPKLLNFPALINDEYVPYTPAGREHLVSLGTGGPLTAQQIKNGLAIECALANKAILFNEKFDDLRRKQLLKFKIPIHHTFQQRVKFGKSLLSKQAHHGDFGVTDLPGVHFQGMLILEALSELDHPFAENAKSILTKWLGESNNRIQIIIQCAMEFNRAVSDDGIENDPYTSKSTIKKTVAKQVAILTKDIQTYANYKNSEEFLVVQLIEVALAFEFLGIYYSEWRELNQFCSDFYRLLLDSSAIDDSYKADIEAHKNLSDNNMTMTKLEIKREIIAINDHSRHIFFPYKLELPPIIFDVNEAKHIQKSIKFFQKVIHHGCLLLKTELSDLESIVKNTFKKAGNCAREARQFWGNDQEKVSEAIHLYECAENAGHPEAKVERLTLLVNERSDKAAQFERAKFYLHRLTKHSAVLIFNSSEKDKEEMLLLAKEELETAANNGFVEAATLLAQHYSTFTLHQPKFKPSNPFKDANVQAIEFLDMAVRSGFEEGQAQIAQNKIPDYLQEIVKQLGPSAMRMIFSLSEDYENSFFKTEYNVNLANVLFKIALDAKYPAALNKLRMQEEELARELAMKLQKKMEDLEKQGQEDQIKNSD